MKIKKVNYSIEDRWQKGVDHNPKSVSLYKRIAELDYEQGNDFFCFKSGGDGDNGEHLMYLLDIYFDELKAKKK